MLSFQNYCIITPDLGGIGGAQLYTIRRLNYLKSNHCKVFIVTGNTSNFKLKNNFEGIEILEVPEISLNPILFTNQRVKKTYNKLIKFLNNKSIQIIESHTLSNAIYAENIANELKCKHIIYLLNENKIKFNYGIGYSDFFYFKLNRRELFGVSSKSLDIVFSTKLDSQKNRYINIGYDVNELTCEKNDIIKQYLPSKNYDLKILTIARLDKHYIKILIKEFIKLSIIYPDKTFFLLIIGESTNNSILRKLKKSFKDIENCKIVFSGYIYPLPKEIFNYFDLFIGQGTASVVSISQGCATAIISDDYKSPGFLGIHTNNFGYAENGIKNIAIFELLISIIKNPNILILASESGKNLFYNSYENIKVMNHFDDEIIKSIQIKEYWFFTFKKTIRVHCEFVFIYFLGIKKYLSLFNKIAYYLK